MTDNRKYFLDWLRVIVVLLIVPHHSALTYSHIGKGYIYTQQPINSLYYFIQSDFLNLWFMILLFFISGISSFYSIKKRDSQGFLKERIKKLIIPTLFVLLLLGPVTAYIVQLKTGNFDKSILIFYPIYLRNISLYLGWAQMWYCVYLFTFSIITMKFFKFLLLNNKHVYRFNDFLMRGNNLYIPMVLIVIIEILLRPIYPGYQNLINDWANFIVYLSFYILGFFFGQSINIFNKIKHLYKQFLFLALFSTTLYIYIHYKDFNLLGLQKQILGLLKGVAEYSWVMVIITISKNKLNIKNKLLEILSKSSFGLYIFHYAILTIITLYLLPLNINHYFKFIISVPLTYLIYLILYKFVILKIKPLRSLCGI